MTNCKYITKNGRCGLKDSYAYRHSCFGEDMCRCREPMTNADRIRAMGDEEMAEWVTSGGNCVMTICDHICGGKCSAIKTFKKSSEEACKEIVMKWLQQPTEEDGHD